LFDCYACKKSPSSTDLETAYGLMETGIATFGVERASGVSKRPGMIAGSWVS
jgi:hypothetical protein